MYPSMRSPFKSTAATIEVGQNVLLSYAINDPNGATGITDTSGNNLANFTYQLENFSAKDYTAPEGWTDPTNGNFIRFGFSENVAHFSDYDAATNSVAGNIFDPNRIKDAITINVDGRNLNPADYSLEPDGNGIRINLVNQYSRIYEGQTVTLSYDESLIPEADRLIDYSGNLLERGTQLVTNDSALTAPDLIPPSLDFSSSSADGQTISLTFSEQLNDIPDKNAFRLSFNGMDVGPAAIDFIEVAPALTPSASADFSYAEYEPADFAIRLDPIKGIDPASFAAASVQSAFSVWVNGNEKPGLITPSKLSRVSQRSNLITSSSGSTTPLLSPPTTALKCASRPMLPLVSATWSRPPSLTSLNASASTAMLDPGGSNTPADYNNPEAYTLNLKLNSEYALGAAETLVISYAEGSFGITDASGSNQLRGFEQVVSNNSTAQGRDTTAMHTAVRRYLTVRFLHHDRFQRTARFLLQPPEPPKQQHSLGLCRRAAAQ